VVAVCYDPDWAQFILGVLEGCPEGLFRQMVDAIQRSNGASLRQFRGKAEDETVVATWRAVCEELVLTPFRKKPEVKVVVPSLDVLDRVMEELGDQASQHDIRYQILRTLHEMLGEYGESVVGCRQELDQLYAFLRMRGREDRLRSFEYAAVESGFEQVAERLATGHWPAPRE
jgi:hypothetical protein